MRCMACHRLITDAKSIRRKLGPICAKKHGVVEQTELEFFKPIPLRFQGKSMREQHIEAMRVLMKRGKFKVDLDDN